MWNLLRMGLIKVGCILTFLVLMSAVTAVFAQLRPPSDLLRFVGQHTLVYDQKCNVPSQQLRNVECLIYEDVPNDIIWLVFFDEELTITRVYAVHKTVETRVWCRFDVCV